MSRGHSHAGSNRRPKKDGPAENLHNILKSLERAMGIEPTTSSLGSWRSTAELRPRSRNLVVDAAPSRKGRRKGADGSGEVLGELEALGLVVGAEIDAVEPFGQRGHALVDE